MLHRETLSILCKANSLLPPRLLGQFKNSFVHHISEETVEGVDNLLLSEAVDLPRCLSSGTLSLQIRRVWKEWTCEPQRLLILGILATASIPFGSFLSSQLHVITMLAHENFQRENRIAMLTIRIYSDHQSPLLQLIWDRPRSSPTPYGEGLKVPQVVNVAHSCTNKRSAKSRHSKELSSCSGGSFSSCRMSRHN